MSPNAGMSEEERRDLIARQHRALYGNESSLYSPDSANSRQSQDVRASISGAGGRGPSPLAFDPFGTQAQGGAESAVQMPPRDHAGISASERANSTSSPSSNPTTFGSLMDTAQQSSRTSNSSPGGSPPLSQGNKPPTTSAGVAPIGTRPIQGQAPSAVQGLNKRSTTPLPSPLSYGFSASEQKNNEQRSTSSASNPPIADKSGVSLGGWGSNSGVWGSSKNTLGVQASVWG